MVKVGLAGAGHLGKIHARLLKNVADIKVVGVYDLNPEAAKAVEAEYGIPVFNSYAELMAAADAVDIVTPTTTHFDLASQAIRNGCHVFIEKPVCQSLAEANKLLELAREADVVAQVGHVERFNPAFLAVKDKALNPMFIESHRLANWNPRGADVSVVLDLMIHDLDIIQKLVAADVKSVSASGVAVVSDTPDIANARIVFHNGAVANLTASRISMKNMRKMRLFQKNAYLSLDFLDKKAEMYEIYDGEVAIEGKSSVTLEMEGREKKTLVLSMPDAPPVNAIQMELEAFAHAIKTRTEPPVTLYDACRALETAQEIIEKMTQSRG